MTQKSIYEEKGAMIFKQFVANDVLSKIRLLQHYVVLWIHVIEAICRISHYARHREKSRSPSRSPFDKKRSSIAIVALRSPIAIAIILLTVNKVFFIRFIAKLVHNNLKNGCLMQPKAFFRNVHSLSSDIFEILDLQNVDC